MVQLDQLDKNGWPLCDLQPFLFCDSSFSPWGEGRSNMVGHFVTFNHIAVPMGDSIRNASLTIKFRTPWGLSFAPHGGVAPPSPCGEDTPETAQPRLTAKDRPRVRRRVNPSPMGDGLIDTNGWPLCDLQPFLFSEASFSPWGEGSSHMVGHCVTVNHMVLAAGR